jgi:hypothetical protein
MQDTRNCESQWTDGHGRDWAAATICLSRKGMEAGDCGDVDVHFGPDWWLDCFGPTICSVWSAALWCIDARGRGALADRVLLCGRQKKRQIVAASKVSGALAADCVPAGERGSVRLGTWSLRSGDVVRVERTGKHSSDSMEQGMFKYTHNQCIATQPGVERAHPCVHLALATLQLHHDLSC